MTELGQELFSEDGEEVKLAIVRGMQRCAKMSEIWYKMHCSESGMKFMDGCPLSFKPGVSDRLLFRRIVEPILDSVVSPEEYEDRHYTNETIVGASVMGRYYYPYYEWFDRRELEEAKCST